MELNEEKTEYVQMTRIKQDVTPLEVEGMKFKNVTQFQYLGSLAQATMISTGL